MSYDYLIVGAGLFGAVFAHEATKAGKRCLVVDRRFHVGGNVYTEEIEGVTAHKYGAHIFHTNDKEIWDYVNQFAEFNRYTNCPVANYKGEIYNLPFNMNTFNKMWGVITPDEASAKIKEQRTTAGITEPKNLEEQAISLVGVDIYEKLVKGYTEKQWGRPCNELPSSIIKRLPVRFTYDNNYFDARYQGIPVGGYTAMIENMLCGVDVRLGTDYLKERAELEHLADRIVYTGAIDEYYGYCLGALEYRSVRFETEVLDMDNFQGNAVVNYTDSGTPYTRIIEHKHFEFGTQPKTVISREYSREWAKGIEPYYPVNDKRNEALAAEYKKLANAEKNVIFGGRLGEYKYYDMDAVIKRAFEMFSKVGKKMDIKLFVCCHKKEHLPDHELLKPIQVGAALADERFDDFLYDDTGENISTKNRSYCELTAQYWAWKNANADYYGFFHYRRFLYPDTSAKHPYRIEKLPELSILDKLGYGGFAELIEKYDVIAPIGEDMHVPVREHYADAPYHHGKDLVMVEQIIREKHPEMERAMEAYLAGTVCYFGNIYIMKRQVFYNYCMWLFPILDEFDHRANLSGYSHQELRVDGYLAERLFGIWLTYARNGLSVLELPRVHFVPNKKERCKKKIMNWILPPGSGWRAIVKKLGKR